ncbi:esterase-like activity of phytase family protein [Streptomyces roseirectus]|uniref:Esterase-like activity of phytase family protein n=1 Tax=Streptomyces roseirectus TaxID=2768066 RepID=A0A7H0IC72_9ACTN|nr:esterase-like activity of phytase family protein [Streptomyces roseirectus]QNP70388.1 esterase-like activity of phytase family protein [Streptomyces roseirectus]
MTGTGGANSRIDAAHSACVLIGVDAYTQLAPLRAVKNNLTRLKETLTDPDVWGVPGELCQVVSNPGSQQELIAPIRKAASAARGTLIVYYAGHGFIDPSDGALYLTLPDTEPGEIDGAVPYEWLRRAIRDNGSARRRIVVLDCCYSGKALDGGMSAVENLQAAALMEDVEGSYVATSCAKTRLALSPRGEECTAFTGELVKVLAEGDPDGPEELTLDMVFGRVRARLKEKRRPLPQVQNQNGVGSLPFVKNRQWSASAATPPPPASGPTPAGRKRWSCLLAVAAVTAVAATVAVQADPLAWWKDRKAAGPCSKGASLLSVSDALNRATELENLGANVDGLSAISLNAQGEAWVLADNKPGRLFRVRLGSPEHLAPEVLKIQTLKRGNGVPYSEGFDGEGLVVEKGGKTVLISSEADSTIRRFRLSDGRELGTLPVPAEWASVSAGGRAGGNRNLESLTTTTDGRYLYTGLEGPLVGDGDRAGRNRLRIQRYKGTPGGAYALDGQFAYEADAGAYLVDLVALGPDRLLALERSYASGLGNSIRVYEVSLAGAKNVTDVRYLAGEPPDSFVTEHRPLVLDLADCPAGDIEVPEGQTQPNPLLDNVEGMALDNRPTGGGGHRVLYLVSDNNSKKDQVTRVYAVKVKTSVR